jgi:hypothetical protein
MVIEAVNFYDDYDNAPTAATQAALVNAGAQFATHMLTPEIIDKNTLLTIPVLNTLNLYQDEVEKILQQTENVKGRLEGLSS